MNPHAPEAPALWWFLVLFAALWIGIAALLSRLGGWGALAERYPSRPQPGAETFRIASMSLGAGSFPVSYSNCLSVRVGREGLGLSLWLPFRAFHPDLFIPWRAVERCGGETFWLASCTAVYVTTPATRLLFRGRVGRTVEAQWARTTALAARP